MAISSDYPRPITVNGFVCRNCDDVSDAKKFIDPAAPAGLTSIPAEPNNAVSFGGNLAERNQQGGTNSGETSRQLVDRYA